MGGERDLYRARREQELEEYKSRMKDLARKGFSEAINKDKFANPFNAGTEKYDGFEAARCNARPGDIIPIPKGLSKKERLWFLEGIQRYVESSGVKKYDEGKAPIMQGCVGRFPLAIEQLSRVSEYGCRKYGTFDGWETLPDAFNRYDDAMGRHIVLRLSEGEYDVDDSGLPHLAQRAWNAMATLELAIRKGTVEMTDGNDISEGKPVIGSNGRTNGS